MAATADEVVTWGGNGEGQCGQGERSEPDYVKPRSLRALRGIAVTQVMCGAAHTLVVTSASQVGVALAHPVDMPPGLCGAQCASSRSHDHHAREL